MTVSAILSVALLAFHEPSAAQPPTPVVCALTEADRTANRRLSFRDFDQLPTLASNARSLGNAGCYREAAEATQDYLAHGPLGEPGQRAIMAFHMAQYLASAGDERTAAWVVTLARRTDIGPEYHIDWNAFVDGMRAFFIKDRPALDRATAALRVRKTEGDDMNARALERLGRCFDRPYGDAWTDDACASARAP